jgi:hypothetical protein
MQLYREWYGRRLVLGERDASQQGWWNLKEEEGRKYVSFLGGAPRFSEKQSPLPIQLRTQILPAFFSDCLALEDGTDRLTRNVGNELPIYIAGNPRRWQISYAPRWKPEITHTGTPLLTIRRVTIISITKGME